MISPQVSVGVMPPVVSATRGLFIACVGLSLYYKIVFLMQYINVIFLKNICYSQKNPAQGRVEEGLKVNES